MDGLHYVPIKTRSLEPLADVYDADEIQKVRRASANLAERLRGGIIWNVNSTAKGGGVAELLTSLIAYARGAGIDSRWAVITGEPEFFRLTKRLHNALHGVPGDDWFLHPQSRELYERVCRRNGSELLGELREGDVVILHDPQTLGLAPVLKHQGVRVFWRCHIGSDSPNSHAEAAQHFLAPYLRDIERAIFTRAAYVPRDFPVPSHVLSPTIDPLSPKNQPLSDLTARAILVQTGLLDGPAPHAAPEFHLPDGATSRVNRGTDVIRLGRACETKTPMVLQVSRWDRLKDHLGVLRGFARFAEEGGVANLVLAGPSVHAVADDPEGAAVFDEVLAAYRALPHGIRSRVELANLPMADADENAAIVNAMQRQSTMILQKSLQEGFGLTVTEAMWKAKPVIASRVGGIPDQIEHERSGILLDDPRDTSAFAKALAGLIAAPAHAAQLGAQARARVKERFLSLRSLYFYMDLITDPTSSA